MFTIDASVWINAESPAEKGQPQSQALLAALAAKNLPIIVPTLMTVEIAGAISRTRSDAKMAGEIVAALLALPHLHWIALDESLSERAAKLAAAHKLRGADAVYAAVAVTSGCSLVTLDHEHLTRLHMVVKTLTPADALLQLP